MRFLNPKSWIVGLLFGAALGLAVAAVMAYLDWRLNPSGIYRDETGTHWDFVFETAWSWFLPVALIASAGAIVVHSWISRAFRKGR